jgi:predicted nucleic acid-binding protein
MRAVFADTSFGIALTNENDAAHQKAQSFRVSLASLKIITSVSVLTEYLNYFAGWGRYFRDEASANVSALLSNATVTVETETTETFAAGLQLYRQRLDKGYSLTDCISMQIMRHENLTDVLTNDRHFEQEGLRALFRS